MVNGSRCRDQGCISLVFLRDLGAFSLAMKLLGDIPVACTDDGQRADLEDISL